MSDRMNDIVTYEFDNGSRIAFEARAVRELGLSELLRRSGVEQPATRVPVFQGGRQIGSVPGYFEPLSIKPASWFYDPRPGDFKRSERGWEAAEQLGQGDLDAIQEFVWADEGTQHGRAKRIEEDRALLVRAITSRGPNA